VEYDEFEEQRRGADLPARIEGTTLSHAEEQYIGKYSDPIMGTLIIRFDNKDKGILILEYAGCVSKICSGYLHDWVRWSCYGTRYL
ncbi:hypothetical protein BGZ95_010851, partial [Linnemannia exigua]